MSITLQVDRTSPEAKRLNAITQILNTRLLENLPFYGNALMSLSKVKLVDTTEFPVAATNGRCIYVNKSFVHEAETAQINFAIMHVLFHIFLMHSLRSENLGIDKLDEDKLDTWNIACDYMVNYELSRLQGEFKSVCQLEVEAIDGCLMLKDDDGVPTDLSSFTEEELYKMLLVERDSQEEAEKANSSSEEENGEEEDDEEENEEDEDTTGNNDNSGNSEENEAEGDVPEDSGGSDAEDEESTNSIGIQGDLRDLTDDEEENSPVSQQDQIQKIKGFMERAKQCGWGSQPGSFDRAVQQAFRKVKMKWYKYLRRFLTERKSDNDSYLTPNKKYIPYDLIIAGPGAFDEEVDNVFLFFDTSGSMSMETIEDCLNHAYTISTDLNATIAVGLWHTKLYKMYENVTPEDFTTVLSSIDVESGGTDVECVYEYLSDRKVKPSASIIFTDGCFNTDIDVSSRIRKRTFIALTESWNVKRGLENLGRIVQL